jgi:GNAT superfamily N-acetyltransferase
MNFSIVKADSKSQINEFINCQWNFYKNDKNWVPPLKMDRAKLLDKSKNPFYKHSEMQLFLAKDVAGTTIGRIAGIVNYNHNEIHKDKLGFFGFFESVNNQEVASGLLNAAADYVKSKGMNAIRGPVNPSMNDETALLIDGFDTPPVVLMTYNPPYYKDLIENVGFAKAKDLYAYHLVNKEYVSDKMKRMQQLIRDRYKVTIREVNFKDKTQFKKDVALLKYIYNNAWQPNWGFVKMTDEEFDFLANDLKQIADPTYTIIAEIDGKPAGFALGLPDINQSLIHNKGGGIIGGVWHLLTKKSKIDLLRIIVLGVLPEYQKTGVDAVLYWEMGSRGLPKGIKYGEASWILEDNEMMNRGLTTTMLGKVYKTYRLFDKALD